MAGCKAERGLDSTSLLPVLQWSFGLRWFAYTEVGPPENLPIPLNRGYTIRIGQYKLIVQGPTGQPPEMELYDLENDPGESNNLMDGWFNFDEQAIGFGLRLYAESLRSQI
jgi:hypothetical protein